METTRFDAPSVLDHPVDRVTNRRMERLRTAAIGPARVPLTLLFVACASLALATMHSTIDVVMGALLGAMCLWVAVLAARGSAVAEARGGEGS